MEDLLKVGVITTTHGIRGEVKVYPTTDADRFLAVSYTHLCRWCSGYKPEHRGWTIYCTLRRKRLWENNNYPPD